MQFQRIQQAISAYESFLKSDSAREERLYYWESQRIFQENWNAEAIDFAQMFDQSLQNTRTRRLWNRENYEPKRLMLLFIAMQPDLTRQLFADLFNENKDVTGRMDRFLFYCDELLRDHRRLYPVSPENSHYHNDDYQMISLYLAFRYPDRYAPYRHDVFRELMVRLGSPDIPRNNDPERYFKVMRTLQGLLTRQEGVRQFHANRISNQAFFQGESLLLAFDFACFSVDKP
ncbi:MAG: hypothetical protein HUU01_10840 [Saprospiraceae bacterium]|nr:hypothetical protein [Saprospiraceae bacterium]